MKAGDVVVITGRQGIGKTTLAMALTDLMMKRGFNVSRFSVRPGTGTVSLKDIRREANQGRFVIVETATNISDVKADLIIDIRFGNHEGRAE